MDDLTSTLSTLSSDELELLLQLRSGIVSLIGKNKTVGSLQNKGLITKEEWYKFKPNIEKLVDEFYNKFIEIVLKHLKAQNDFFDAYKEMQKEIDEKYHDLIFDILDELVIEDKVKRVVHNTDRLFYVEYKAL